MFWGDWGLVVKVLVRDRLGAIAPPWRRRGGRPTTPGNVRLPARLLAKTFGVASRLAVVPRLLDEGWLAKAGIDPCEKKTKRREFARWREGVLPGLPAGRYHCHSVSIAYLLLRQRRGEVRKKIELRVGESP